jgi:hypothetical protein
VLLSWHSDGFPLRKAQAYAAMRRPFLVNDVGLQDVLLDRRRVYKTLQVGAGARGRAGGPFTRRAWRFGRRGVGRGSLARICARRACVADPRPLQRGCGLARPPEPNWGGLLPLPQDASIPVPTHIVVSRDGLPSGEDPPGFVEEVGLAC